MAENRNGHAVGSTRRETDQRRGGVTLGRVAGVTVRVDSSVLIIAALLTWSLAADALPASSAGYSVLEYWFVGGAAALLALASLLAHELAHSVVARRHGVPVQDITLWMLGGISSLEAEPPDAATAFRIAIVGPATSLAIGVGAGVVAALGSAVAAPALVVGALVWLASINVVLAVFNLLPAAPLDGGRVLAAVLWRRHGDRQRAASTAAFAGRVLAFAMIALGALEVAVGLVVGGAWLLLLGWFVLASARAEGEAATRRTPTTGPRVADVMNAHPITVPSSMPVEALFDDYALRHDCASFPVVEQGAVVGLVTSDRVRARHMHHPGPSVVRDVMWPMTDIAPAADREPLATVVARMHTSASHCAFVFHDGRFVGLVTPTDLTRVAA
jgi:Zn-dependent protease/CBS domain-containing protein